MMDAQATILAKAAELIESLDFDMNGLSLPSGTVPGHGGLISIKTIKLSGEMRRLLYRHGVLK